MGKLIKFNSGKDPTIQQTNSLKKSELFVLEGIIPANQSLIIFENDNIDENKYLLEDIYTDNPKAQVHHIHREYGKLEIGINKQSTDTKITVEFKRSLSTLRLAKDIVDEMNARGSITIPQGCITGEEFEEWLYGDEERTDV